ncbi:MAG TPA: hypothetical protein VGR40_12075 [Candidatus Binatus sp.]|nr:hypothetical protein [Candidatus Binatus sp.]
MVFAYMQDERHFLRAFPGITRIAARRGKVAIWLEIEASGPDCEKRWLITSDDDPRMIPRLV